MRDRSNESNELSFFSVLFLILLVLKLTKVITWSWWWVTAPIWGGFLLAIVLMFILYWIDK